MLYVYYANDKIFIYQSIEYLNFQNEKSWQILTFLHFSSTKAAKLEKRKKAGVMT